MLLSIKMTPFLANQFNERKERKITNFLIIIYFIGGKNPLP